MRDFCNLYSKNDIIRATKRYLITPYYWTRYKILTLKDDIKSNNYLKPNPKLVKYQAHKSTDLNWNLELKKAVDTAKPKSSNNQFSMENNSYNNSTKGNL